MIDDERAAMADWAAARGLAFEPEGLLPPLTDALRAGLGAGDHRAGFVTRSSGGVFTAVGGFTKRPERSSWNVCSGRLPGGADGVLAHHVHLEQRRDKDGQSWYAFPRTVVLAVLPDGVRAVRWLTGRPGPRGGVATGATISLGGGGEPIVPVPAWRGEVAGVSWTAEPAEEPSRIERIAAPAAGALADAPAGTSVELRDGALAVVAPGVVADTAALDALCAVAGTIAAVVAEIVASEPPLGGDAVAAPAHDARGRWLADGAGRVAWEQPPASVEAAQAAYREIAVAIARRSGSRWKIRLIALVGVLMAIAVWAAIDAVAIAVLPDERGELLILGAVTLIIFVPLGLRAAWRAGGEADDDLVAARARPWGLEGFATAYAAARGLALEDPTLVRHRFRSPIAGVPLRVMHGDLGGVTGRLALWVDDTLPQRRHLLVAIVPAPAVDAPSAAPGYAVHVRDGLLVLAEEVPSSERTVARLDALAAAAARAAAPAVA